uniref:Uncharacterized protein n=1 Tax=Aegilops tauschii subsp. strangulata TaxID=200361 RepID=A0A452XUL7_AEGTS
IARSSCKTRRRRGLPAPRRRPQEAAPAHPRGPTTPGLTSMSAQSASRSIRALVGQVLPNCFCGSC